MQGYAYSQFTRLCALMFSALLTLISGCDNQNSASPNTSSSTAAHDGWPRTVQTLKGPLTLQHPPQRIVSTSVTITGTLLAIDAQVIGSGATSRNSTVSDDQGFFIQWGKEARARNIKPLYITEPNAEAIAAASPDLIIIAATGGDSALKLYDQLSAIAPTLVIDYGDKSWQQLAEQLGVATGREKEAHDVVDRFEQRVQAIKQAITLPPQPVSALVYYEDGRGVNIWTRASAQGQLLSELGFQLADLPPNLPTETSQGKRRDIVQISGENMADSLNGKSLLMFSADEKTVGNLMNNPFLRHIEPVEQQHVWAMGPDTFRLDYYSANNMLNNIEHFFRQP